MRIGTDARLTFLCASASYQSLFRYLFSVSGSTGIIPSYMDEGRMPCLSGVFLVLSSCEAAILSSSDMNLHQKSAVSTWLAADSTGGLADSSMLYSLGSKEAERLSCTGTFVAFPLASSNTAC